MAVLPSPANTNAPEAQGFEANLDDLFLRFAVGPGRQMNINTAPLQAQAIQTSETPEDFQQEFGQIFSRTDFAGGSGLAPIKSLLEGGVIDQIKRDVVFLFGARTQDDLYCVKELEEIKKNWNQEFKFDFIPVLNMEPEDSDWNGGRGFVTDYFEENVIRKNNLDISDWQGYLCGPPPMVDAASSLLQKHGIKVDEIFYDKFTDSSNL